MRASGKLVPMASCTLDGVSILFSSVETQITQALFVTTPPSKEYSEVCSYPTVEEVMVIESYLEDYRIDKSNPHYSTSGVEIESVGIFSPLTLDGAPCWIPPWLN